MREQFEIDNHLPEQENVLREFLGGQNIFVNLPTVYGKSLIILRNRAEYRLILSRRGSGPSRLKILQVFPSNLKYI